MIPRKLERVMYLSSCPNDGRHQYPLSRCYQLRLGQMREMIFTHTAVRSTEKTYLGIAMSECLDLAKSPDRHEHRIHEPTDVAISISCIPARFEGAEIAAAVPRHWRVIYER